MARVQQQPNKKNNKNINKQPKKVEPKKVDLVKKETRKEPSKNEILFYRVGLTLIVLTLVTVAIIFIVRSFMDKNEEELVFEDYIHITQIDLMYLTYDDGSGVYGDFSYFSGLANYEDLREVIYSNQVIYVYFYRSSNLNEEIKTKIESMDLEGKAFLFLDLDSTKNANVLEMSELVHLNLPKDRDNILLTFNYELQTFSLDFRVSDILIELNKI